MQVESGAERELHLCHARIAPIREVEPRHPNKLTGHVTAGNADTWYIPPPIGLGIYCFLHVANERGKVLSDYISTGDP